MNTILLLAMVMGQAEAPQAPPPSTAPEDQSHRVLMRTVAGDLVFALDPRIAPLHCEKVIRLVMAGAYHGTHFHRLEPGFVLQHAGVQDRTMPLSAQQAALVTKLKAERSTAKHVRGALSMAREDGDPDSGTSSFSILLGTAPHLDGQYTIFGALTHGWEVIENFQKVPRNGSAPLMRLSVTEAWYVPPGQKLPPLRIATIDAAAAAEASIPEALKVVATPDRMIAAGGLTLAIIVVGVLNVFLQNRIPAARMKSMGLIAVFLMAFLFLVLTIPISYLYSALSIGSFLGLIGLFKLLGQFESAV
jgi:cyclophilin family peptidyl-prolyl cis-trans isomerase